MKKLVWLLLLTVLLWSPSGYAAIPKLINYQGRFSDSQGRPITAIKKMAFRLYDANSGGTLLWESIYDPGPTGSRGVTIDKGVFNEKLGEFNNGNGQYKELKDVPFDKQYYLEIVMEGEVLSPRQLLTSSAYAIRANVADEALQAQNAAKVNNIEASTTPQANKLLPLNANAKFPAQVMSLKTYDSGWFNVSASDSVHYKDLTHNLGTTSLLFELLYATAPNGSGTIYRCETGIYWANGQYNNGGSVRNITTTTARVTWGGNYVYQGINDSGQTDQLSAGSYKLIILALD